MIQSRATAKENHMLYSRRDIGKMALAAGTAARLNAAKPNSTFGGVHIGVITYSFRALTGTAEATLQYCLDCGIDAIELMSNVAENYAGAPAPAGGGGQGRGRGATPEQQAAQQKAAAELKQWRLSVPMEKYKAFRKMYADAGVSIYAFKLPPTMAMSDHEY